MTLRSTNSVVGGLWRGGSSPQTVWYGDMTDQGYPNAAVAHPWLINAELMNSSDPRAVEAAEELRREFLKSRYE